MARLGVPRRLYAIAVWGCTSASLLAQPSSTSPVLFNDLHFHLTNYVQRGPSLHEFLAVMLGVRRPTVTVVLHALQESGLISSRYGRMRVLKRRELEAASCECYAAIRRHFVRLGL